jgi:hypothetical protein
MPFCPKCGKELETPESVCAACAPGGEPVPSPAAAPAPPLTVGQRALIGAKKGALLGALYGGVYGLIQAVLILTFVQGDTIRAAAVNFFVSTAIGVAVVTPIGALLRIVFPGKPKTKDATATDPSSKRDTKIDRT